MLGDAALSRASKVVSSSKVQSHSLSWTCLSTSSTASIAKIGDPMRPSRGYGVRAGLAVADRAGARGASSLHAAFKYPHGFCANERWHQGLWVLDIDAAPSGDDPWHPPLVW